MREVGVVRGLGDVLPAPVADAVHQLPLAHQHGDDVGMILLHLLGAQLRPLQAEARVVGIRAAKAPGAAQGDAAAEEPRVVDVDVEYGASLRDSASASDSATLSPTKSTRLTSRGRSEDLSEVSGGAWPAQLAGRRRPRRAAARRRGGRDEHPDQRGDRDRRGQPRVAAAGAVRAGSAARSGGS